MARKLGVWLGVVMLGGAGEALASGGEELPFNRILDTVFDNLTGPTARTLVGIALVLGLCTVMFGRDSEWARPVGKVLLGGAAIAGIPTVLNLMGVAGAGGRVGLVGLGVLGAAAVGLLALAAWALRGVTTKRETEG